MPSLTCPALYWRRSIRSSEQCRQREAQVIWNNKIKRQARCQEEYLTPSVLPGALVSYTFKHIAILMYSSIPHSQETPSAESLLLTQLPVWVASPWLLEEKLSAVVGEMAHAHRGCVNATLVYVSSSYRLDPIDLASLLFLVPSIPLDSYTPLPPFL